jgi:hypothetical protein
MREGPMIFRPAKATVKASDSPFPDLCFGIMLRLRLPSGEITDNFFSCRQLFAAIRIIKKMDLIFIKKIYRLLLLKIINKDLSCKVLFQNHLSGILLGL